MSNNLTSSKTTTFEALLGILTMGPMTGYEIRQRIEISIGNFWSESFGQIYPALSRLHQQGFVRVTTAGKAGRKVYALTPAGRKQLKSWLKVLPQPQKIRNEMLLKLFFGDNNDFRTLRAQVQRTRDRSAADLARYAALEPQVKLRQANNPGLPYMLMTLDHGCMGARAILAWADKTLAKLARLEQKQKSRQEET